MRSKTDQTEVIRLALIRRVMRWNLQKRVSWTVKTRVSNALWIVAGIQVIRLFKLAKLDASMININVLMVS